jgi:hypothetical protein
MLRHHLHEKNITGIIKKNKITELKTEQKNITESNRKNKKFKIKQNTPILQEIKVYLL